MTVIVKKSEKVASVVATLPHEFTFDDFMVAFQQLHPKDWQRVVDEYQEHKKRTKLGKIQPMPEPTQYLRNALNVHLKQVRK